MGAKRPKLTPTWAPYNLTCDRLRASSPDLYPAYIPADAAAMEVTLACDQSKRVAPDRCCRKHVHATPSTHTPKQLHIPGPNHNAYKCLILIFAGGLGEGSPQMGGSPQGGAEIYSILPLLRLCLTSFRLRLPHRGFGHWFL